MNNILNKRVSHDKNDKILLHKSELKQYFSNLPGGIVHCFTGSKSELVSFLDLGLFILSLIHI